MDSPSPSVEALRSTLVNEGEPLARRFRALFALKHVAAQKSSPPETSAAIAAISAAFSSPSALLKHELAYCLGQSGQLEAGPCLLSVLQDEREDPMCRHEAAEALGALGDGRALDLLRKYSTDALIPTVIRETCEIALDRIVWQRSQGSSPEQIQTRFANSCIYKFCLLGTDCSQLFHLH